MKRTLGSEALAAAVSKHGAMSDLARKLGVYPNMVSRWAGGERVPRMPTLVRLKNELGIPVEDWGIEAPAPSATGTDGSH